MQNLISQKTELISRLYATRITLNPCIRKKLGSEWRVGSDQWYRGVFFFFFGGSHKPQSHANLYYHLWYCFLYLPKKCLLAEFQLSVKYILLFSNQYIIVSTVLLTQDTSALHLLNIYCPSYSIIVVPKL